MKILAFMQCMWLREVWQGPAIITCHPAARSGAVSQLATAAKELRDMMDAAISREVHVHD